MASPRLVGVESGEAPQTYRAQFCCYPEQELAVIQCKYTCLNRSTFEFALA